MNASLLSMTRELTLALKDAGLSPAQAQTCERLLSDLQRPAQVIVMGRDGSGKTSLVNALLGGEGIPALADAPIVEIVYGATRRFSVEAADETPVWRDGVVTQDRIGGKTYRVVQELPVEVLKSRQIAEIGFGDREETRAAVLDWAMAKADIAIWCSQDFDATEAALWSDAPNRIKDYGILALTKADQLQMKGLLAECRARFEEKFADEFYCLFPVATKHAIAACANGSIADEDLWRASGYRAFVSGLDRLIASGKTADLDRAELFLARLGKSAPDPHSVSDHAVDGPAPHVEEAPHDHADAETDPSPADLEPMERCEALETALKLLHGCADDLQKQCETDTSPAQILDHCGEAAHALTTLLMDTATDDPRLGSLREDAIESEQMIQLFQLERTEDAAADAVAVLLQLKKELSQVAS